MPDPICIGLAGKHWPEASRIILAHWLASGLDPFGQNLTQSARTKLDPSWFCTILSGMSVEEWNRVWKWETGSRLVASCQKPGPMIPAHQLASRPDEFGQTLTRPSRSDPSQFCTIWSMPSLEKQSWNGCRKSDPAYILSGLIMAACWLQLAVTKMLHVYWAVWRFSLKKELNKFYFYQWARQWNFFTITWQISGFLVKL